MESVKPWRPVLLGHADAYWDKKWNVLATTEMYNLYDRPLLSYDSMSLTFKGGGIRASIPKSLYQSIVKIQAEEGLEWIQACDKAALLLNRNAEEFKRSVERQAQSLYKSRFMKQLNKSRESITEEAAWSVRDTEDNFRVPCAKCGKWMYFSSIDDNWEEKKDMLYRTFGQWAHTKCPSSKEE